MCTEADSMKLEMEAETCCVCGAAGEELLAPEEHDAGAERGAPPLRAVLLHLSHNKVVPSGRLCGGCARRARDAYSFSAALAGGHATPLGDKITALRQRLHELTQKIDVFIVVGGGENGGEGAYGEDDVIMVDRGALEAGLRGAAGGAAPPHQCSVCPCAFGSGRELHAHLARHPAGAAHACWTCGARLPDAAAAARHAAADHAAPDQHHCYLCNNTFQSVAEMRAHSATCQAACPACGLAVGTAGALRAHAASSGECALCGECLRPCGSRAALAAHRLLHRRDRHFVCGYRACILRFHTRSNLLAHIRKCHAGDELLAPPAPAAPAPAPAAPAPVACPRCPRVFSSPAALQRHARAHRDVPAGGGGGAPEAGQEWGEGTGEGGEGEGEGEGGARVEYLEMDALEDALA